jgi:hypothetical protein
MIKIFIRSTMKWVTLNILWHMQINRLYSSKLERRIRFFNCRHDNFSFFSAFIRRLEDLLDTLQGFFLYYAVLQRIITINLCSTLSLSCQSAYYSCLNSKNYATKYGYFNIVRIRKKFCIQIYLGRPKNLKCLS